MTSKGVRTSNGSQMYQPGPLFLDNADLKCQFYALRWRRNGPDSVSNHQPHDCAGNSPGTSEFSAQRASNAENVFIWWRHHGDIQRQITHHPSIRLVHYHNSPSSLAVNIMPAEDVKPCNLYNGNDFTGKTLYLYGVSPYHQAVIFWYWQHTMIFNRNNVDFRNRRYMYNFVYAIWL